MKREELRQWFAEWLDDYYDELHSEDDLTPEVAESVLSALRPVSREAWTAEWTVDEVGHKCSKCGEYLPDGEDVRKPQFCPECGRAMTDEAVEMVMERLEELHGETETD